jgi:hypothetical protein
MKIVSISPWFNLEGYLARKVRYEDGRYATQLEHRVVMEQILGRELSSQEIVHHKDKNKRNNSPENLELTTKSVHAKHHAEERPEQITEMTCSICSKDFSVPTRTVRRNEKTGKAGPFCSKTCAGRYASSIQVNRGTSVGRPRKGVWTDEDVKKIHESGLSANAIAKRLNASRWSVVESLKRLNMRT